MKPGMRYRIGAGVLVAAAFLAGASRRPPVAHGASAGDVVVLTLAPPGADPVLLARHRDLSLRYPLGSQVAVLTRTGGRSELRVLSTEMAAAGAPDVSPEGREVVFAGRRTPSSRWGVYTAAVDGSGLRPVIESGRDCGEPAFLAHDRIAFACAEPADASGADGARHTELWVSGRDGKGLERITFGVASAAQPSALADGRVLFVRESESGSSALFTVNPDGTVMGPFLRDLGHGVERSRARQSHDGGVVFLARSASGELTAARVEMKLPEGTVTALAPLAEDSTPLQVAAIEPLRAGGYLVAGRQGSGGFGLWRWDGPGRPGQALLPATERAPLEAVETTPALPPRGRPSSVRAGATTGTLICYDVRRSADTDIATGPVPAVVEVADAASSRTLGQAPIRSDGSFSIEVPADQPLRLTTLAGDGSGRRSCDAIALRPGEVRACFGCHESPTTAPVNRRVAALEQPPAILVTKKEKP